MARKSISQETRDLVVELSNQGQKTIKEIAEQAGISVPSVSNIRKSAGLSRSRTSKSGAGTNSGPVEKTIAEPQSHRALEQAVTKLIYGHIKAVKSPHDGVDVQVSIRVGDQTFNSLDELIDAAAQAKKDAELAAKEAELLAQLDEVRAQRTKG